MSHPVEDAGNLGDVVPGSCDGTCAETEASVQDDSGPSQPVTDADLEDVADVEPCNPDDDDCTDSGGSTLDDALLLWLDADDLVSPVGSTADAGDAGAVAGVFVSEWKDRSAGKHDMRQTLPQLQPTLVEGARNGHNVVRFDGIDDSMEAANTPLSVLGGPFDTADLTVLIVASPRWVASAAAENPCLFGLRSQGATRISGHISHAMDGLYTWNSATLGYAQHPFVQNQFYLIGFAWQGGLESEYVNGTSVVQASHALGTATGHPFRIASSHPMFEVFQGDIAEVRVFGRALSVSELDGVESKMMARWGVAQ